MIECNIINKQIYAYPETYNEWLIEFEKRFKNKFLNKQVNSDLKNEVKHWCLSELENAQKYFDMPIIEYIINIENNNISIHEKPFMCEICGSHAFIKDFEWSEKICKYSNHISHTEQGRELFKFGFCNEQIDRLLNEYNIEKK